MINGVFVVCPGCGAPMVWLQGRWRCQCQQEMVEGREEAQLDLLAVVWLPESVSAEGRQRWNVAEALVNDHGLCFVDRSGNGWVYHHAEHACTAWVTPVQRDQRRDSNTDTHIYCGYCGQMVASTVWSSHRPGCRVKEEFRHGRG